VLLRLDPLSSADSVSLVRQAGGGQIADAQAADIAEHAGGNPFFIIETAGMLLSKESRGAGAGRTPLPPTVQAVVSARLDAMPARLRDLARRASVFIHSFELEQLVVVDGAATVEELHELEEAEVIVREQSQSSAPTWRLRHATLKEVAYASLPKRERLRLHQLIAQHLVVTDRTSLFPDHLELAAIASLDLDPNDRAAPELAADALLAAGDRARRRMEIGSAINRYDRALVMAGPEKNWGVREARVLAGLGEVRYWLADYRLSAEALSRAVTLAEACDDMLALALALCFLSDIAINYEGDVDRAEKLSDRSLQAAEQLGEPAGILRTLMFAGWVPWIRKRHDQAEVIWRRALSIVDAKDRWGRVRALTHLSINRRALKDLAGALELIEEANAIAQDSGDQFNLAKVSVEKARVFDGLGRHEEALRLFDRGAETFTELGARWELADARIGRGIAKRGLGQLDEAEKDLQAALRIAEDLGDRLLPGRIWRSLARVADVRGDRTKAEELRRRAVADAKA
jgi:tetratricopeptide (TPR) repeat protein